MDKKILYLLLTIINIKNNKNNIKYLILRKNLYESTSNKNIICEISALVGDLALLQYTDKSVIDYMNSRIYSRVTDYAATNGNLECLKYAVENAYGFGHTTTLAAASHGHLECLKFLYETGCQVNPEAADAATKNGHNDCAQYINNIYAKRREKWQAKAKQKVEKSNIINTLNKS